MKKLIITASLLGLISCSDETPKPLLYTVEANKLNVNIPAKGELFAAKATNISAPVTRRGMQNIAWLAPEFIHVKKGDIIARLDGEAMMIQAQEKTNELAITREEITEKNSSLEQQISAIKKDIGMIDQEKDFADKFSIDDIRIQSKLEILDQMQNAAYLGSKQEYLYWKNDSFSASSQGELGLLYLYFCCLSCHWARCRNLGVYLRNIPEQCSCLRTIMGSKRALGICSDHYIDHSVFLGCYGRSIKRPSVVYLLLLLRYDGIAAYLGTYQNAGNQRGFFRGIE